MDVTVLYIVADLVVARIETSEAFAEVFCSAEIHEASKIRYLYPLDYIVVSRDDEILWVVDGMTPGWYIPENTRAALDRYPELKGKF